MEFWFNLLVIAALVHGCANWKLEQQPPAIDTSGKVYSPKWHEAATICKGQNGGVDFVQADPGTGFACKNGVTGHTKKKEVKEK